MGTVDMSEPTHVIVRELQKVITNGAHLPKSTCAGRTGFVSTDVCLDDIDPRMLAVTPTIVDDDVKARDVRLR